MLNRGRKEGRKAGGEREERNVMQGNKQQMGQRRLGGYSPQ